MHLCTRTHAHTHTHTRHIHATCLVDLIPPASTEEQETDTWRLQTQGNKNPPRLKLVDLLYIPPPPPKQTITQGSGRVLTSVTHIKMMEEKLRKKEEEAELKEQRKRERSRKKALKEAEKERKEKE